MAKHPPQPNPHDPDRPKPPAKDDPLMDEIEVVEEPSAVKPNPKPKTHPQIPDIVEAVGEEEVLDVSDVEVLPESSRKHTKPAADEILDIGEVEVVESPSSSAIDAVVVVEEPSGKQPPVPPKQQPPAAPKTMVAQRAPAPTMLAPPGAAMGPGSSPDLELPPMPGEPAPKQPAAPTMIGPKQSPPTMLAGDALDLPNMELGSGKTKKPDDSGVINVAEEVEEVLDAAPASDPRMEVLDTVEVVESGKHPKTAPEIFDEVEEVLDADEVLDVTEEAPSSKKEPPAPASSKRRHSTVDLDGSDEGVLVEGESEIDLARKSARHGMPSGVDLIAEALESGVDLGAGSGAQSAKRKDSKSDSGALDLESVHTGAESSEVDLGSIDLLEPKKRTSPPKVDDVEEVVEEVEETTSSKIAKELAAADAVEVVGEDAVVEDVFAEASPPPKAKTKAAAATALAGADDVIEDVFDESPKPKGKSAPKIVADSDEDFVVPKKGPTKVKAGADDEEDRPVKRKPAKARGGAGKVLVGILLGILVAVGGLAAVWAFAPSVLESIPASQGAKWQKDPPPRPAAKGPSTAEQARGLIGQGKFDDALNMVKDSTDDKEEVLARAIAKWQKYRAEQFAKDEALDPKAPEVLEAIKDFEKAEAKDDPYLLDLQKTLGAVGQAAGRLAALEKADAALRAALNVKDPKADLIQAVNALAASGKGADALMAGVRKALLDAKLINPKDNLTPDTVKAVAKDLTEAKAKVVELAGTLKTLEATSKALDGKLQAVNGALKAAGVKAQDDAGVKELFAARNTLNKQKAALDSAIALALKELQTGGLLPPGNDPTKQLVEGTKAARIKAETPLGASLNSMFSSLSGLGAGAGKMLQKTVEIADQSVELAAARARMALSETPEQRLDTVVKLYRGGGAKDPMEVAKAARFVEWVNSKDAKAGPEVKAKALWALGLAQRNQGDMPAALKSLQGAAAAASSLKSAPWAADVAHSLKELTDPAVYYLPTARDLLARGEGKMAVLVLSEGLKAMPNNPQLLAMRALVRLEGGPMDPGVEAQVRDDAAAVQKSAQLAAEGHYLLGRLEEQLGNHAKAEASYREAIKLHQGSDEEASVYRSALARLLLREPSGGAEPAPKGKAADTSRLDPTDEQMQRAALVVLTLTAVQAPAGDEDPEAAARLKEVLKLAQELAQSKNPKTKGQGLMILGQALSKQGKRSEGMLKFVEGMRLFYDNKDVKEMEKLVKDHPAFQQSESAGQPSPLAAERHFGKGLELFWARQYPEAEEQFAKAIGFYDQDARYFYYLGLARYQQKGKAKREAAVYAFTQGAALEGTLRPHSSQVNASLERLQGPLRQVLNEHRQNVTRPGP